MAAIIAISLPLAVSCLAYAGAGIAQKIEKNRKREINV